MPKKSCQCAWMPCGHCRKHHNGPNGACTKCPLAGKVCRGFI